MSPEEKARAHKNEQQRKWRAAKKREREKVKLAAPVSNGTRLIPHNALPPEVLEPRVPRRPHRKNNGSVVERSLNSTGVEYLERALGSAPVTVQQIIALKLIETVRTLIG